jgi:hypothetical protein
VRLLRNWPVALLLGAALAAQDFDREVRPLLAARCFKCHGPDAAVRKAGLRLDRRDGATAELRSGARALVPGAPQHSALLERVRSDSPKHRMPPPSEGAPLRADEIALLERWIAAGAEYVPHWSFVPPAPPEVPAVGGHALVRNPIDAFVLAALEPRGLAASPEADRATLIRRVSLDLVGLPPTPAEIDAFESDAASDAYERLVERLLASPHYGERQARRWLDLARYADTNGYEKDRERSMWPWRDWVIRAINEDLPFDRFTVEQLAGDMLPGATQQQIVATGFHRNTMINEEGGIDVEEFRYESLVDRVGTTGTTWLGLTLGCAQCHTHKYDPITHEEFFGLLAFFDNTDEIVLDLPDPEIAQQQREHDAKIDERRAALAARFPPPPPAEWRALQPLALRSEEGASLVADTDGVIVASGSRPERDVYEVEFEAPAELLLALRVEAVAGPSDAEEPGPGRTKHGNFVLGEVELSIVGEDGAEQSVPFAAAEADFAQDGYPVAKAIDGKPDTGWGIKGDGEWRVTRHADFRIAQPLAAPASSRLRAVLRFGYGNAHTLGRFRLSVGLGADGAEDVDAQRTAHLEQRLREWLSAQRAAARPWHTVVPETMRSAGLADFRVLDDDSVLLYGNNPDRDSTFLTIDPRGQRVTALRLEALPHDSLPASGPGRSPFFPEGGFIVSDLRAAVVAPEYEPRPVAFAAAHASFAPADHPAAHAIDEEVDSGWTNAGRVGRAVHAVFVLAQPLECAPGERLELTIHQHSIHNNNLGRFRISLTDAAAIEGASALPADLEARLAGGETPDPARLRACFLEQAPELAAANEEIRKLENERPRPPTTLVLHDRGPRRARATHLRARGVFTNPRQAVRPHVPEVLPPLPEGVVPDRLALARWLVDPRHPLVARVAVNREWEAFFGRGIVATPADFGTRGDRPTHPELLDWLATEFVRRGWSRKELHRLIVTSATYRQAAASGESAVRDPDNVWLARASRLRLDAELIRDAALRASGLLVARIGGPSVFPPQPEGTGGLTYGSFEWQTATGEARFRRGLYTFAKRTAPYVAFSLFDGPSGETCLARRERTNTPLQALALLNDVVFGEAARALGRIASETPGDDAARVRALFRRCLARPAQASELAAVLAFASRQEERLRAGELSAATILGAGEDADASLGAAKWTLVARVVLNLDEMIVRS